MIVVGPLAPGQAQATQAFGQIALASAAGLLVMRRAAGFALRRALQPVHDLAAPLGRPTSGTSMAGCPNRTRRVATMAREFNRMLERIGEDEQRRRQLHSPRSRTGCVHRWRWPVDISSCGRC